MLFDDRDLNVIENEYEKQAFQEVLQTYYGQNYRASVVSLYSLVMLDLYNKLQYMADEGETKARKKLEKVNQLIADDEKYSLVEKEITTFFVENYSLHFNKFVKDLAYLKETRDDCAHLKVNATSLSVPKDYQVRMLISSMFENVLAVKAPFVEDLFTFMEGEIEELSSNQIIDNSIYQRLVKKYFSRMTPTSLMKSIGTFIQILFWSPDVAAIQYAQGLYVVLKCLIGYSDQMGFGNECAQNDHIRKRIEKIDDASLALCPIRREALFDLLHTSRWFCDACKENPVFQSVVDRYLYERNAFQEYFPLIYPERMEDRWRFYLEKVDKFPCDYQQSRYDFLKDAPGFSDSTFIALELSKVPDWEGFYAADAFMDFFDHNKAAFSDEALEKVLSAYNGNNQFYNRRAGAEEMKSLIDEVTKRKMAVDWSRYDVFSPYVPADAATTDCS